jgi:hypothetical protein
MQLAQLWPVRGWTGKGLIGRQMENLADEKSSECGVWANGGDLIQELQKYRKIDINILLSQWKGAVSVSKCEVLEELNHPLTLTDRAYSPSACVKSINSRCQATAPDVTAFW